jgi:integrase
LSQPSPHQVIAALALGSSHATLQRINPTGSLQARRDHTGAVTLFWRYSIGTRSERVRIGIYDSKAPPRSLAPTPYGYSIAAAVNAAQELAHEHYQHREDGGRPALLHARHAAAKAAAEEKLRAQKFTLRALLLAYCDHLEAISRRSHRDARSIFKLHVFEAWPAIAALPASQVVDDHVADMMRSLVAAGKGRTANKLRAYVRSAFQVAKASKSKPSIPEAFRAFGVVHNPAAETLPDEAANRSEKDPLSANELRAYWRAVKALPGFKGAVLRLHLLTGGQRIEQLVNLKTANIETSSITLLDGKGRPGKPARPHRIPLTKAAVAALKECHPDGEWAVSTDGGTSHLAATTLSAWAREVAATAEIETFKAKRIRSGIETLLAASGVSLEHRGRLQSHGVSGVQARHYDGHEYMTEKRAALEELYRQLTRRR